MRSTLFVLIALLSVSTLINAYVEEDGSLTLTELDFHKAIKEYKNILVNFHALWCRYSKKLKPEWNKLVENFKGASDIKFAKVEAYDEKKLAEEYDIEGYPTIKMFINGEPHDYNGERLETHLHEFVDRKLKKSLSKAGDAAWVKKQLMEYEWIGVLGGGDESGVIEAAFEIGDVLFVTSSDDKLKEFKVSKGKFTLINNITKGEDVFEGTINAENIKKFVAEKKFPAVPRFSKGTAEKIFLSETPSMILIRKSGAEGDKAEADFNAAYESLKDKIFMSVANYDEEIGRLLAENLGVKPSDLPEVRIVKPDRERIKKWFTNDPVSKESILAFYNNFSAKKAERYYLSEVIPTENKDLVRKVVGDTFKAEVLESEKDVLIMFWAPWCGHCRAMMPVYDNVARKTRLVDNFVVAKIDASVNELEGYGIDIVEYPTILLFTKKDKQNPIEFKGERNEYVFNDFIRQHASVPLDKMKGPNPFDKNEL